MSTVTVVSPTIASVWSANSFLRSIPSSTVFFRIERQSICKYRLFHICLVFAYHFPYCYHIYAFYCSNRGSVSQTFHTNVYLLFVLTTSNVYLGHPCDMFIVLSCTRPFVTGCGGSRLPIRTTLLKLITEPNRLVPNFLPLTYLSLYFRINSVIGSFLLGRFKPFS